MEKEIFRKQLKTILDNYFETVYWILEHADYKLVIDTGDNLCCARENVLFEAYETSELSLEEYAIVIISSIEEQLDTDKGNMEYKQFRMKIISDIKNLKGVHEIKENLFKLILSIIDGMAKVEIDMKEAYEDYKNGIPFKIIKKHIVDIIDAEIINAISKLMKDATNQVMENRDAILDRVIYIPEREESIEENILSEIPNLRLYGMRFLPCVDISCNIDGVQSNGTVYIDKAVMKKLGISQEQLYDSAIKNIKEIPVMYRKTSEDDDLNIAHTGRCLCVSGKNTKLCSNLLYKPFFDKIGAAFQEPYYLVVNNDLVMSAYPASETSICNLKSEVQKYQSEHNTSSCGDIIFYYKNGIVEVK